MPATPAQHEALNLARTAETAADHEHQGLHTEHAALTTEHAAAVEALAASPTAAAGKDVLRARDACELGQHLVAAAASRLAATRGAREAAEAAIADAQLADDVAAALAAVDAATRSHRATTARAEELRAVVPSRTIGARIAAALAKLAADERKALEDATTAEEQSTSTARDLEAARAQLAALSPDHAMQIEELRQHEAAAVEAARVEHLSRVGSVPGLAAALAPVVALRLAGVELGALAVKVQTNTAASADAAAAALGLGSFDDFRAFEGGRGAWVLAPVIVLHDTHGGPRDGSFFHGLGQRLGGGGNFWPQGMPAEEAWRRILSGERLTDLHVLLTERRKVGDALAWARATEARTDPILKARAAAVELEHGLATGVWIRVGRERELLTIIAAALHIAREASRRSGPGYYVAKGGPGDDGQRIGIDTFDANDGRRVARLLGVDAAELPAIERLAPPPPHMATPAPAPFAA